MRSNEGTPTAAVLEAKIVRYDDAPDECTLFPADVNEDQRTTAWITAREDSFCSAESRV